MAKKILNLATFGLVGQILGGSKKAKTAPVADPQKPTVMPLADDEAVRRARRRGIISQLSRRGRESTILAGDRLGG